MFKTCVDIAAPVGLAGQACADPCAHSRGKAALSAHGGKNVRMRGLLAMVMAIACGTCAAAAQPDTPIRVLFVGNSITYVGNLPAVLNTLAASQHRFVRSDMIVRGGATLMDRLTDGSVERALAQRHYDYVVLQERGGDLLCSFGPKSCRDAVFALHRLARAVRAHGAKPIYLGTYQTLPIVSTHLVAAEARASARWSIAYVAVSDRLQLGMKSHPAEAWLYADGAHPGHALALLEATLLYRALFGMDPLAVDLEVDAPMYKPDARFSPASPTSQGIARDGVAMGQSYPKPTVAAILEVAAAKIPGDEPNPAPSP